MRRPTVKVRAGSSGRTAGPVALVALLALLAPGPATAAESGLPAGDLGRIGLAIAETDPWPEGSGCARSPR